MQARQLPARHGAFWLIGGLQLLRRNPPLLTALTFGYLFLVVFINVLPLIGPVLLPMILPVLTVILANGCRGLSLNQPVRKDTLWFGLAANRVSMLRLGALQLLGSLAILAVSTLIEGGPQKLSGLSGENPGEVLAMLGRLLLIAAPVLMAFWFAPLLTAWDGIPATKAVFFSLIASLRNWRAFLAYGVAVTVVGVAIPGVILLVAGSISASLVNVLSIALRMLLIFILAPVLVASVFLSYRDVFHGVEENA